MLHAVDLRTGELIYREAVLPQGHSINQVSWLHQLHLNQIFVGSSSGDIMALYDENKTNMETGILKCITR